MTLPDVQRVHTDSGSHIEPPLDPEWTDLNKLRWNLAVTLHDAGLPADTLGVEQGHLTVGGQRVWDDYHLTYRHGTYAGGGYHAMWSTINGVGIGLRLASGDDR